VFYIDLAITGVSYGCMYALMAVGLTLVYGLLRILHIAHAAVFTLGAYVMVLTSNATGSSLFGIAAAALICTLLGMLIYRFLYEPLLRYPPDVPLVASLGLLILLEDAFRIAFGEQGVAFKQNPLAGVSISIGKFSVGGVELVIVSVAAFTFLLLYLFTTRARIGVAWRATVSNPRIAASFGVDAIQVRYLNFAIGSALAGVAGSLVALLDNFVDPATGLVVGYKALAIIVLGGLGSITGTLMASLLLGVIETYGTTFLHAVLSREAIAFLFLILVLLTRPQGLWGVKPT
jgi:branched-chain amino acid transport system permease protein